MRNYDEDTLKIAERIFEKGDSILAERSRRAVRIKRVSLTVSMLCASVLICFGAWSLTKNTELMKKSDADITVIDTVSDTTKSAFITTRKSTTETTYTTSEQVTQTDESTAIQTMSISTNSITTAVKTTESAVTSHVSTAVTLTATAVTTETSDEEISVTVITTENTQETAVISQLNTTALSRPVTTSAVIMPVTSAPMTDEQTPVITTTTIPLSVVITTKVLDVSIEETSPVDTPENNRPSLPESIVINGIVYGYYGFMGNGNYEFLQMYTVGYYELAVFKITGLPEQLALAFEWKDGLHMYYNYTY